MGTFPIEGGVPLFLRPTDVSSIPGQVMEAYGISPDQRDRVESALATLTKYKTSFSSAEFSNFFDRLGSDRAASPTPVVPQDLPEIIPRVQCIAAYFNGALRAGETEFRSVRLRNNSDRVVYTADDFQLYLSYKLYDESGAEIPFEGNRTHIPCPIKPGSELTCPVEIKLPQELKGKYSIAICFILESERWFDDYPLFVERFEVLKSEAIFPATRRGNAADFALQEDLTRSADFISSILRGLYLDEARSLRILEIGAGVYPICLRAELGPDVTLVTSDLSLTQQQLSAVVHTGHLAVEDGRVGFASIDAMNMPFAPGTFDLIVICAALHHFPSPDGLLRVLAELLSPNGRFVAVREPCVVNPYDPTYRMELASGFDEQVFELAEWREIVRRGGMVIDRAEIDYDCSLKFSAKCC